jgi:glucokinase
MIPRMPVRRRESVVAVDLGGTKVAAAVVDGRGRLRERRVEAVDRSAAAAVVDQIVRIVKSLADGAVAVGVAVPGLVRRDGTVWAPNLPQWDSIPLGRILRRRLRMPAFVESDRNAAVLGEAWRGAARRKSDVIVLIVGTGIGAGILSGGRLVRGAHELSGCAGWLVVGDEENTLSRRIGSLEALAAGPAIARAHGGDTLAAAEAARRGDGPSRALFLETGRLLGLAVANLISVFDPEVIVLTGGMTRAADLFLDELKRTALERAQPLSAPHVEIAVSTLQTDANLLGTARLALMECESTIGSGPPSRSPNQERTTPRKPKQ